MIPATFGGDSAPEELPAKARTGAGLGRNSWPLAAIRKLADAMIELAEAEAERGARSRWLNLCGFCLRPGFGFPGDDYRIEQARGFMRRVAIRESGAERNRVWIFWGRVARAEQESTDRCVQRLSPTLLPRSAKRPRVNPSLLREMWRAAASLEFLPIQTKTHLGDELVARIAKGDFIDTALWCLARLGRASCSMGRSIRYCRQRR